MARERTIVGIGEMFLSEYPDRDEAGGLAIGTALDAMRTGHVGVVISRIGQDTLGQRLLDLIGDSGVDLSHVQRDPDLPTARRIVRVGGSARRETIDEYAAFDNLQWDFDLEDVAQNADAVVCSALGGRQGQARSVIERFLDECRGAVRIMDVRTRPEGGLDRGAAESMMSRVDGVITDLSALRALAPGTMDADDPGPAARSVLRAHDLTFMVVGAEKHPLRLYATDDFAQVDVECASTTFNVAGLLHSVLSGRALGEALEAAVRIGQHLSADRSTAVPSDVLDGPSAR